jgi:lysophospholipase L1-like esterase
MQGYFPGWSTYNMTVQALNREIVPVANARGVPVADSYSAIVNHGWNALFVDRLHFNDWGYEWIAWGFYEILTREYGILQR